MCLSNPAKIIGIKKGKAIIEIGGRKKEVETRLVKGIKKGDYCLVSNGFIIKEIPTKEAKEIFKIIKEG